MTKVQQSIWLIAFLCISEIVTAEITGIVLDNVIFAENLELGETVGSLSVSRDGRPALQLEEGLVAHYPFEGNAKDHSGMQNHAKLMGGSRLTEDRFGRSRQAIFLDGEGDWLELSGLGNDLNGAVTFSAWVQASPSDLGTRRSLFAANHRIGSASDTNALLLMIGQRSIDAELTKTFVSYDPITSGNHVLNSTPVADGLWHHLVYATDGRAAVGYVDGVAGEVQSVRYGFRSDLRWSLGQEFDEATPSDFFKGLVDEVRIFNRQLKAEEVEVLYQEPTFRLVPGEGSSGNDLFKIVSNRLVLAAPANFEANATPSIRILATGTNGETFEQVQALKLLDANDPPLGITLSPDSVKENLRIGSFVGALAAIDQDHRDQHSFTLVQNAPVGYDNAKFTISKTSLFTAEVLDFEANATHRLLVQVTDSAGATFEQEIILKVENDNDAPTKILFEGKPREGPAGTVLGKLIAQDIDPEDSHSFRIIGGADKASFLINGDLLSSSRDLDYEQQSLYQVMIRATDHKGLSYDQLLDIAILDANDAPTDILLEPTVILENQPAKSLVGTFRLIDPDGDWTPVLEPGEPQEYLVEEFSGNQITEAWAQDFINSSALNHNIAGGELTVQSIQTDVANKDTDGDWAMVNLSRKITRLSNFEAKWTIGWDQHDAEETTQEMFLVLLGPNEEQIAAVGIYDEWHRHRGVKFTSLPDNDYMTSIGTLAYRDNEDTITVSREGKIIDVKWNNWLFASSESEVPLARVELLFGEYPATIGDIVTKSGTSKVKELRINGVEAPKAPTYEMVAGKGDADNAFFDIEGNLLLSKEPFNFEQRSQYSIRVKGIDPGDLTTEKVFTISIDDSNDGPSSVQIDQNTVYENLPRGTTIGTLTTVDEDKDDAHRWVLLPKNDGGSEDNQWFSISGNTLRTATEFDFEEQNQYILDIRTTDAFGAVYDQEIIIQVTDANDPPSNLLLSTHEIPENQLPNQTVATLSVEDEDASDVHSFHITGGKHAKAFTIKGNQLISRTSFDFEQTENLELRIQANDSRKAVFEKYFQLKVTNGNDAPTKILLSNREVAENQLKGTYVGTFSSMDPDAVAPISIPLHFHNMIGWKTTLGDSQILNDFDTASFHEQLLPAINQFFAPANLQFTPGRIHEENLAKLLPKAEADRQKLKTTLLESPDPSAELYSLMASELQELGTFQLYLFPFVGAETSFRALPQYASHNAIGLWQLNDSQQAIRSNLTEAAIAALLSALGGTPAPTLTTETIRKIRLQAFQQRPIVHAPIPPAFPSLKHADFAKVPLADQRYNIQRARQTAWVPYASTHPISQPNTTIRRILLLTQGVDDSLPQTWNRVRQTLANEAQDEKTLLIAPQFLRSDQIAAKPETTLLQWADRERQLYGSLSLDSVDSNNPQVEIKGTRIDTFEIQKHYPKKPEEGPSIIVENLISSLKETPTHFSFLHLTHPDSAGHGNGWGRSKYHDSIRTVDADIGLIFDLVENHAPYQGNTIVLLTADHGGGGDNLYQHTTPTEPLNYTIPFYAWGKGVQAGAELYDLNQDIRSNPPVDQNPAYSANSQNQPIRNGSLANLSASILGQPPIPGSWINPDQDLKLSSRAVRAKHVIAISVDGLRPMDIEQLGEAELPNLFRFQKEGAYTHNARTDTFITRTLPNHTCMMTGRGTFDVTGTGNGHRQEHNSDNGRTTIHDNSGVYIHSIFDSAKQAGLQTALFANKTKFALFYRTWNGTWDSGDDPDSDPGLSLRLSTYEVIDDLLRNLVLNSKLYPNLQEVVLLGHGDGADLLQRYSLTNPIDEEIRKSRQVPVRYLLYGADSYFYPDSKLPYPYGLQSRPTYSKTLDEKTIIENFHFRSSHILVGTEDLQITDHSTHALKQGGSRVERAIQYLTQPNLANTTLTTLEGAGHNLDQLFQNPAAIFAVLGKTAPDQDSDGWADLDELSLSSDPTDPTSLPERILHTYNLVQGGGGEHNSKFQVSGDQLSTSQPLDFESTPTPSIRVEVTDPGGLTYQEVIKLELTDNNDPPLSITLETPTIPENQPIDTLVSLITGVDPDHRDKLIFSLVDAGETRFAIAKERLLLAKTSFNFEEAQEHTIIVRAMDLAGSYVDQEVTIRIADVNEPPTGLAVSSATIQENLPKGSDITEFLTSDPDLEDTFAYSLVPGEGSFDNDSFRISKKGLLQTATTFDFEGKKKYFIRVRVTDAGGNILEHPLRLEVLNSNDPPTGIQLSSTILEEENPAGTLVGHLSTIDPDVEDTHTYSFVSGTAFFEIQGTQLVSTKPVSRKQHPQLSLAIKSTDSEGASTEQTFTINIVDSPDAPTDILLDNSDVKRYSRTGTLIGALSTKDADPKDSHTYRLTPASQFPSNAHFFIEGNHLLTNHFFDENAQSRYTLQAEVEDSTGNIFQKSLTIQITEAPRPEGNLLQITKDPADGGLVAGGGYYTEREIVELRTVPSPGRHFSGHTGDLPGGISAESSLQFKLSAPANITSTFSLQFHQVIVNVSPVLHGGIRGGGTFLHGSTIDVYAEELPKSNQCHFSHWTVNGERVTSSDKNPLHLQVTVEEQLHILAHFEYGLHPELKFIPAGTFRQLDKPLITPFISNFYMPQYETTKRQWYDVYNWAIDHGYIFDFDPAKPMLGRNLPHSDPAYLDSWPITGITWMDAAIWCNARSEKEGLTPVYYSDAQHTTLLGKEILPEEFLLEPKHVKWRAKGYRLPTNAEWEKAARGKLRDQYYPNGNSIDASFAHYNQRSSPIELSPVGGKRLPNGYGLYDMSGNAWEVCWDWYWGRWFNYLYEQLLDPTFELIDPIGPTHEQVSQDHRLYRNVRGGDANSDRYRTRIGFRKYLRTWSQYAISVRPVVSGPSEPMASVEVFTDTPHWGSVSGAGIYLENSEVVLTASPRKGMASFLRWEDKDGNSLGSRAILKTSVDADSRFIAVFAGSSRDGPEMYSLQTEVLPDENGTIRGAGAYLAGVNATLTAKPNGENQFAGWAGDGFGVDSTLSLRMDANKRVQGYFGDTSIDSDQDGLSDLYETSIGSNAYWSDSDNDGLKDYQEVQQYQSNPTKVDTDGDGFDDKTEFLYQTQLNSAQDFPFIVTNQLSRYFLFKIKPFDYSGNKGHGRALQTTIEPDRAGLNKSAYGFDGSQSYFEATSYTAPTGSASRTFAMWIYRENQDDTTLLTYESQSNFAVHLVADKLQVEADAITIESSKVLPVQQWFQILVTLPDGGSVKDIAVYLDGLPMEMSSVHQNSAAVQTTASKSVIFGKGSKGFFRGKLDDLRIWERFFAASEAQKLYDLEAYREPEFLKPTIQQQPQDQLVAIGGTATFTVEATGKPQPTYQWQKIANRKVVDIPGAHSNTLIITNVSEADIAKYQVRIENSEDTRYSGAAKLLVLEKPQIITPMTDLAFLTQRGGKIIVNFTGAKPLTFEWFKDNTSILKTTKNQFPIPKNSDPTAYNGTYQVRITNPVGEITSEPFKVSILDPIEIQKHPTSLGVTQGAQGSLSVEATGGGTIRYQWQKYDFKLRGWTDLETENAPEITFDAIEPTQAGRYWCILTNGASTVSTKYADIAVYTPPAFQVQPRNKQVNITEKLLINSEVTGSLPLTYQWQKFNSDSDQWEDLPKMTRNYLYYRALAPELSGLYRLRAINPGGTTYSDEMELTIYYPPTFTRNLEHQLINEDAPLSLQVETDALDSDGAEVSYQWFFNRKPAEDADGIQGSRTNHLQISNTQLSHQGYWYCEAQNEIGTTTSYAIKVILIQKPFAVKEFQDVTISAGRNVSLNASIRGGKPITLQWLKDGQVLKGANRNKLYLRSVQPSDAGTYTLQAINPAGTLDISAEITVTDAASAPLSTPTTLTDFQTAAQMDSDFDGLNDLLEYALGSDPNTSRSTFVPHIDQITDEAGQTWVSFSYTENALASDLHFIVETSKDLQSWEAMDQDSASISRLNRGHFTEVTYYFPAQDNHQFFRVRIEP